ncbi:hypothetical protein, partial [Mariprofundus erugo]|uniref:hypothetical protein n=1 Tax=Mariprofundus erugo TaxID=2528639 RepID=UPI001EE840D8
IIGLASPESGFMYVCFQSLMRCINKHSLAVVDWGSHISPTDSREPEGLWTMHGEPKKFATERHFSLFASCFRSRSAGL